MNTGSHAAKSIVPRRGAGRVRHTEECELWIQDRVAKGEMTADKVKGENHVADGLTKHVERHTMDAHMQACGVVRDSGRRELSLCLGDA